MNDFKQAVAAFWQARNRREQRLLVAGSIVAVSGLLYLLLIDPALTGRADLDKRLPALRQQAAEVQALAREAAALGSAATAPAPLLTRNGIETSLSRRGLKAQSVTLSGDLVKVQLSGVSFAATADWLEEMQKSQRLSVLTATVEAQEQPDTVNASFDLRRE